MFCRFPTQLTKELQDSQAASWCKPSRCLVEANPAPRQALLHTCHSCCHEKPSACKPEEQKNSPKASTTKNHGKWLLECTSPLGHGHPTPGRTAEQKIVRVTVLCHRRKILDMYILAVGYVECTLMHQLGGPDRALNEIN